MLNAIIEKGLLLLILLTVWVSVATITRGYQHDAAITHHPETYGDWADTRPALDQALQPWHNRLRITNMGTSGCMDWADRPSSEQCARLNSTDRGNPLQVLLFNDGEDSDRSYIQEVLNLGHRFGPLSFVWTPLRRPMPLNQVWAVAYVPASRWAEAHDLA